MEGTLYADGTTIRARRAIGGRLVLLAVWIVLAGILIAHHAFWRDEVRALSLALQGDGFGEMLAGVRGEGHPALWYLLLRGAHDLLPVREVLPALAAAIGLAVAAMLALRSPFGPRMLALILFGAFCLFEYTVSARNYGIGMLVLLVIVDRYPRYRDRGIVLGLLLALLCNTNVPCALLAAAMLLFWLIELLVEDGWRWTPRLGWFAINAGIAAAGALVCFVTVYPPVNDAAVHPGTIDVAAVLHAIKKPSRAFMDLLPVIVKDERWPARILTVALVGSLLGLIRSPAAFVSSVVMLLAMLLFFGLVYQGSYRHQALYLAWLVAMYWLVLAGSGGAWRVGARGEAVLAWLQRIGTGLFVVLLALQLPNSAAYLASATHGVPESRSRDLAQLLHARGLERAILIADPDVMLEPMPYYVDNPIWQMHAGCFGHVVRFTRAAKLDLTLGDVLATMRRLHAASGRPVVAVLQHRPDPAAGNASIVEGYNWTFSTTPEQVAEFAAATTQIAAFAPAISDESYAVYLLR